LLAALHADGPAGDRAENMKLYGWLIGSWQMDATVISDDGARHAARGEIHFGWVLDGRAIQDVWILPGFFHGTTLRIYDPTIEAWRIYWIDPGRNVFRQQIGRARGEDIVQEGTTDSGMLSRWSFTEITPNSFHWLGEAKSELDSDWRLIVEVLAQRRES